MLEAATCCDCWKSSKQGVYRSKKKVTITRNVAEEFLSKTNASVGSFALGVENHTVLVTGAAENRQSLHLSARKCLIHPYVF